MQKILNKTMAKLINKDTLFSRSWFYNYGLVALGAFTMALGFVLFINPYNIVPGGVYGIGIVVHYLFPIVPVGLFGLMLNIPLILISVKILGPRFGIKTIVGMILTTVFMDSLTYFIEKTDFINNADPLGIQDDLLLACIFGGVFIGLGLGLIFKAKATSAGSDIIAMILEKYTRFPIGQLLIFVDSMIVFIGLIVLKDWKIPLYSWIVIFVTGKVIDVVMQGVNFSKSVYVISVEHAKIKDFILNDLERGGTYIQGEGMYTNEERKIIYTIVTRRELAMLESFVHKVDPNAFLTVSDTSEILGDGFKSLKDKVEQES